MRALSIESVRAFVLKLLDTTYKELESITSKSKKTLKYHFSIIKKTYPELESFVNDRVKILPRTLEEKIDLADRLTKEFLAERREKGKEEDKTREKGKVEEVKEKVEGTVTGYPYLLEDAIERSISQRAKHMKSDEFEEEKEEKTREAKGEKVRKELKIDISTLLLTFGALMLGVAAFSAFLPRGRKKEKRRKIHPISPSHPALYKLRGGIA